MPNVRRVSQNFMDLVGQLTAAKLDVLYGSKWTCQAVLRSLPPIAKQYVMRLLFMDIGARVSAKTFQEWIVPDALSKHKNALERLTYLRIFLEETDKQVKKNEVYYKLNPMLQEQLRLALSSGGGAPRAPMPPNITVRVPAAGELENYATNQWEAVILQLVNYASGEGPAASTNPFIAKIFQKAGLLTGSLESPGISEAGFQFLLMDRNSQLWHIIREYVASAQDRDMDEGELLRFLLEIGFHSVGEAYSFNTLSTNEQKFIDELSHLGLVYLQQGMKDRWFIPTKLAAGLSASLSDSANWEPAEGYIMVETNFRVYAYTSSKLHIETLQLFVRPEYVLPNILVGSLTKESVSGAFSSGISADHVISYLQKHAHPQVASKVPSVPDTVCDQIRLWENDRNRVEYQPAFCYEGFPSMGIYENVVEFARRKGGLLWDDGGNKRVVIRGDLHEAVRSFIQGQSRPQRK